MSPTPAFELVVVSYRSRDNVAGLLAAMPGDLAVVVVDNSGDCDGVRALVEARPNGRYLDAGGIGFAAAANLGARTSSHPYLVFGNPDSRPSYATYLALVDEVAADEQVASAAASLAGPDGTVELGVAGWEPTVGRALVHAAGLHKVWPRAGLFARPAPGERIEVDWTTGAAFAVRRSTFLDLGGFDEAFYVYSEDVAFGRAVREHGLRQVLRTDLLVPHAAGGSGAPSLEMMRLRGASMARYVARHRGPVRSGATRAALGLGYALRVGHQLARRDVARAREHAAYVTGIATGRAFVGGRDVTAGRH